MLATATTLALLGFAIAMLVRIIRNDGGKVMAALEGRSWTSQPPATLRSVPVRISQRYPMQAPQRVRPAIRAAA